MSYRYLLHAAIYENALVNPSHPAIRFQKEEFTYRKLAKASNQLANFLINLGVKRGDRVGIYMNKNIYSAVAIYGILSAGAAYVPLDPFAPIDRLSFVINDCQIHFLITNEAKKDNLKEIIHKTALDGLIGIQSNSSLPIPSYSWDQIFQFFSSQPSIQLVEQDLAYIFIHFRFDRNTERHHAHSP